MQNENEVPHFFEETITKEEEIKIEASAELNEIDLNEFKKEIEDEQRTASAQPFTTGESSNGNEFDNSTVNSGGNSSSPTNEINTKQTESASLAKLLTVVGDFVLPPIISIAAKKIGNKEIPAASLKGEKDELKAIEQAWNDYLITANFNLSPEWRLAIALGGVYGAKAVMLSIDSTVLNKPAKRQERPLNSTVIQSANFPIQGARLPNGRKATRKAGETRGRKPSVK